MTIVSPVRGWTVSLPRKALEELRDRLSLSGGADNLGEGPDLPSRDTLVSFKINTPLVKN